MKQFLIASLLICSLIYVRAQTVTTTPSVARVYEDTPRHYLVSFTEQEWNQRLYSLEIIKSQLKKTDLPARDVSFMTDSILAKFQMEVIGQIKKQSVRDSVLIPKPKK